MTGKFVFSILIGILLSFQSSGQESFKSEKELKERAAELFQEEKLIEATPLYVQLLSLYPQDGEYNFKYGACLLASESDKQKPLKYLKFAVSKSTTNPLAYYYLGRAYHLNYNFGKAVKMYSRFKTKATNDQREKYQVDRKIEMCKNGNQLLSKLNEVQVIERQVIAEKDFYKIYKLDDLGGKIISKPSDFDSKFDAKKGEKSIIYLPNNAKEVYYSSYGRKGENGRDIFKAVKLGNGGWSEGVSLGSSINTPFNEDFAFIHPDGRTLYFASEGHSSMGGYDLFKSTFDQSTAKWTEPENLDFAFSSADDDIMFVTDKDQRIAYFASNRSNEAGKITVYKVLTERKPAELSVINGKFIAENNADLKKAKIVVVDKKTKETVGTYETDEEGNYKIEIAENGGNYQFTIETTDEAPIHTGTVTIPKQDEFEVLGQELRLVGSGEQQQLVIKNIFDGTARNSISSSGPQVSSEVLRMKANLDVNFSASQLAQLNPKETSSDAPNNNQPKVSGIDEGVPKETSKASKSVDNSNNSQTLLEEVSAIEIAYEESIDAQQLLASKSYELASKNQKVAESLKAERSQLKQDNAPEQQIAPKTEQIKEASFKAAAQLEIAQKVEKSINDDKENLKKLREKNALLSQKIENDQMAEAELLQEEIKNEFSIIQNEETALSSIAENTREELDLNQKRSKEGTERVASFKAEKERLQSQINDLEKQQESSTNNQKEEIQNRIQELELDRKDMDFQLARTEEKLATLSSERDQLRIKKGQIDAVQSEETGSSKQFAELTAEEKKSLIEEVRTLVEKETQLQPESVAEISDSNEQKSNLEANLVIDSKESGPSDIKTGATDQNATWQTINDEFENQILAASNIQDQDLKKAKRVEIYNNWINALETKMVETESLMVSVESENEKAEKRAEIDLLLDQIAEKSEKKDELENRLITGNQAAIASSNQTETLENAETIETAPVDVSQVDAQTSIDDDFTNLKFNQDYGVGNDPYSESLTRAKKTLFEAGEIAKQAEIARESAYSLPTPQERNEAFEKANQLKSASEQKQLEAAEYFAEFNQEEFLVNQRRLENANNYEEEFESGNLDLANLLAEEALVYFNNAAEVRAAIQPADRLSRKEVELQKAYDYEMLALKKQRQALTKLKLADDEVLTQTKVIAENNTPFVQVIADPEILAITNAAVAKEKAENLRGEIESLKSEAQKEQSLYEAMTIGSERDSTLAVYNVLAAQLEEKEEKAALLFERERQLKQGLVVNEGPNSPPKNINDEIIQAKTVNMFSEISIDTVDIDEQRQELVLNSEAFVEYSREKQRNDRLVSQAQSTYQSGIKLTTEKQRLQKQAIVERNKVNLTDDPAEKDRLIKSAEVIDQLAASTQNSIDSINKLMKVKNYLIATSSQKMKKAVAELSEVERMEVMKLAQSYKADLKGEEQLAELNSSASESGAAKSSTDSEATYSSESNALEAERNRDAENNIAQVDPVLRDSPNENSSAEIETSITESPQPNSGVGNEESFNSNRESESKVADGSTSKADIERNDKSPQVSVSESNSSETSDEQITNSFSDDAGETTTSTGKSNTPTDIYNIPRVVKEAIFINLDKNEAAYSNSKPIPLNPELPLGIVYKVQIGAFRNPISPEVFKGFAPLMAEKTASGITRYTAGFFVTERTAIQARDDIRTVGYPDAFVVAFKNGKRISVAAARNENGETLLASENTSGSLANQTSGSDLNNKSSTSTNGLGARFNTADLAEVVDVKTIQGVYFTVQIGVYSKPLKKGTFDFKDLNVVELSNGLIRYNAGIYRSPIEAADAKITISTEIADAFMTAYNNGKRISINDAARLKNK